MASEPAGPVGNGTDSAAEYERLRSLLVGPERSRLEAISDELRSRAVRVDDLAEKLPEAIALRVSRDDHLGRALSPTIDTALRESIRRDPRDMAAAIFPILGPAIRKAIAEAMSGLVRSINHAVEQSLSIRGIAWRVEAWRSGVPYPQVVMKHALIYRVEQVFLVHAETGLLLEHVAAADVDMPEAELVSSMLSAIQDFVKDSFRPREGATLRTFCVGDHTVQLEAGPRALLAVVIRGEAPGHVLQRQQDTLETVHIEFASQLAEFSGDSAAFVRARPLLEDCLETVLSTERAEKRRFVWLRWAIPLALIAIGATAFVVRGSMRWNRALTALKGEPGIVVVDADRDWGRWEISGLRDPSAREPAAVLSAIGITPPSLAGAWEGYISLDPEMVAARANRAMDSLTTLIERERVLFAAGSAELEPPAVSRLSATAGFIRQLDQLALSSGRTVLLSLTGRTDISGADATNATLAQRRVETVAASLESGGIPRSRLVPEPVATSRPLASADSVERARINRSVSFNIELSAPFSAAGGER
ncbi:MAG TPA: OmpA family protein [Gemmatimonadaceae bacterium]|nr:OmpA family protein [Gemmatimonadaceae bacterium]